MKHTKTDWRFYVSPQPNGCPIVGDSNGLMIAQIAHSINYENQKEIALEHARLIAAAPELLEALKEMVDANAIPSTGCKSRPAYEHAIAAIAKATGEA